MSDITARTRTTHSPTAELARTGFLDRYTGGTRTLYELDLRLFFAWCAEQQLDPLDARRPHLEAFGRHLTIERGNSARSACRRLQTIRSFYRLAVVDELIDRDPTMLMRACPGGTSTGPRSPTSPRRRSGSCSARPRPCRRRTTR
ncbi:site-specific integrase [uncultured Microbacterium sp.]|uniref:site-specific integrase n=1 Tax=uncultured Microbacterium sp. TaxID=191216 RepID=UPI00343262A8